MLIWFQERKRQAENLNGKISQLRTPFNVELAFSRFVFSDPQCFLGVEDLAQQLNASTFLKIGLDILRRSQEMGKDKNLRSEAIIEQGNKAAHYGHALADAYRVLKVPRETRSQESQWY